MPKVKYTVNKSYKLVFVIRIIDYHIVIHKTELFTNPGDFLSPAKMAFRDSLVFSPSFIACGNFLRPIGILLPI